MKQMVTKEYYINIANKYGEFASWAVWADQGEKPKSNIGDISIFNLNINPNILNQLNPNVVMVALNFSRKIETATFVNFHDKRPRGQDFKIRYAFKNTKYYGAYMTDIIKDFEEKISEKVSSYLRNNPKFKLQNVSLFEKELIDLKSKDPLIIAFGNQTYEILDQAFQNKYRIIKIPHYSKRISKENYRNEVHEILSCLE